MQNVCIHTFSNSSVAHERTSRAGLTPAELFNSATIVTIGDDVKNKKHIKRIRRGNRSLVDSGFILI